MHRVRPRELPLGSRWRGHELPPRSQRITVGVAARGAVESDDGARCDPCALARVCRRASVARRGAQRETALAVELHGRRAVRRREPACTVDGRWVEPQVAHLYRRVGGLRDDVGTIRSEANALVLGVWMMKPGEDKVVARRLREVLASPEAKRA